MHAEASPGLALASAAMHARTPQQYESYILRVPRGPRFVFTTFCRPSAAPMLTWRAMLRLATSAFGLSNWTEDDMLPIVRLINGRFYKDCHSPTPI